MHPRKKEFLELFHASGWTPAEAARKLEMTRGGMHGLVQGDTTPSMATVKLFRLLLMGERPGIKLPPPSELQPVPEEPDEPSPKDDWKSDILADLDDVNPQEREKVVDALRAVIRLVAKRKRTDKAA